MNNTLPKYLYKYRSMESQDVDRIFTHNEIYLPSNNKFNDPYESRISFDCVNITDEDLKNALSITADFLNKSNPDDETDINQLSEFIKDKSQDSLTMQTIIDFLDRFVESLNLYISKTTGIFSLSEEYNDLLMWSHYANSHKGIVIQFDTNWLKDIFFKLKDVQYEEYFPPISSFSKTDRDIFDLLFWKSKHWDYENEWRGIQHIDNEEDRILKFEPDAITGVILGADISPNDKNRIEMWVKSSASSIDIYSAEYSKAGFFVDIDRID